MKKIHEVVMKRDEFMKIFFRKITELQNKIIFFIIQQGKVAK